MAARALRAVDVDEIPKPKRRMTIREAAEAGDRRALLVAMQERIAKAVQDDATPPRDLAALSRRLQEIGKELETMGDEESDGDRDSDSTPDDAFDPAAL